MSTLRRRAAAALAMLLAAAAGAGCGGHAHPATTPAAAGDAMDGARVTAEAWRQAWEADSYDRVAALYAHDAHVVLVDQGTSFLGWDAASAHLRDVLGHAREIHVKTSSVAVDALDEDCAVVTAAIDRDVSDGAVTTSERGVLTLVLHKDGGAWLVVAEHFSYPHGA